MTGHDVASSMLDVSQVTTGYGRTMIVRDVSLAIQPGEIVAIVGRNGVGKTTLMKAIIGLLPLARGSISLAGTDISAMPANDRAQRGIGYFPQGRGIFPGLTVEENLEMGELINARAGGLRPLGHCLPVLSTACRAAESARGHAQWRRAGDARHRPGAYRPADADASR